MSISRLVIAEEKPKSYKRDDFRHSNANWDRLVADKFEVEQHGKAGILMKDGVWLVPIEERFEGWEKVNAN